jgi:hypothetical protein
VTNNRCTIPGCEKFIKAHGLCRRHYRMQHVSKVQYPECSIEGCDRDATHAKRTLCNTHYQRRYRHGSFESRLPTYGQKIPYVHKQGYLRMLVDGRYVLEHVFLAEKALGRKLPAKTVVHHMNNNPADNHTPLNLVICPNQAYHMLLHIRARELGFERPRKRRTFHSRRVPVGDCSEMERLQNG